MVDKEAEFKIGDKVVTLDTNEKREVQNDSIS